MAEEITTTETTQEGTLEAFNDVSTTPTEPAKAEPAPAAQPAAAEPAPATQPTQPAADPYAGVESGLQIPQGLELDQQLFSGLKAVAQQYNISTDAVKALMQLDLNNNAAQMMAEDKILADAQAKWDIENKAKYGDNLKNVETNCSRVLAELDKDGKFKELLKLAGAERHPATLGFLKTIGDLYLEKASVNPNATVSSEEEVELENFN